MYGQCRRRHAVVLGEDERRYQRALAAYEAARTLVCVNEGLSSLLPPSPPARPARDFFSVFDPAVVHLLLRHVGSYEVFFRFPWLSHAHRWLFCHPDLHRRFGAERFELIGEQWLRFSRHAWPSLTIHISKFTFYYDSTATLTRPGHAPPPRSHSARPASPPASSLSQKVTSGSSALADEQKDWALESCTLYQHIHFATLYLTRDLPSVTSSGVRLRYELPRLLRELLVDRLTSQEGFDVMNSAAPRWWDRWLLTIHYNLSFTPRYSLSQSVELTFTRSSTELRSSTHELAVHYPEALLAEQMIAEPIRERWSDVLLQSHWSASGPLHDRFGRLESGVNPRDSRLAVHSLSGDVALLGAPDLAKLGLWVTPTLSAAFRAYSAGGGGTSSSSSSSREHSPCSCIDVSLESSPLVQWFTGRGNEGYRVLPCVQAATVEEWLSGPCKEGGYVYGMKQSNVERLAKWLDMGGRRRWEGECGSGGASIAAAPSSNLALVQRAFYCHLQMVAQREENRLEAAAVRRVDR